VVLTAQKGMFGPRLGEPPAGLEKNDAPEQARPGS
jgi:hypothetical protein